MSDEALKQGANVVLAGAGAVGDAMASMSDPGFQLGGFIAKGLTALIQGIINQHGLEGAKAARELLERLQREGPQGITDKQLADDDSALEREIRAWYPK